MLQNILSVDLESFIHREFDVSKRFEKDNDYTVKAVNLLLELFKKHETRVTFFVVGEIYQWYPELIETIYKQGHEIGYHSHRHIFLTSKELLLKELKLSADFLKTYKPKAFRAPRMFLKKEYLEILSDYGFLYDSSTYGSFDQACLFDNIQEIPVSFFSYLGQKKELEFPQGLTKQLLIRGIPYGSGLGLSIFGKRTQLFINATNKSGDPAILFFHPWQVLTYPKKPIQNTLTAIPRNIYRRNIMETLEYLLANNTFVPFRDAFKS